MYSDHGALLPSARLVTSLQHHRGSSGLIRGAAPAPCGPRPSAGENERFSLPNMRYGYLVPRLRELAIGIVCPRKGVDEAMHHNPTLMTLDPIHVR